MSPAIWILLVCAALVTALVAFIRWGTRWGATPAERAARMPGDAYFTTRSRAYVAMTRAITLSASPETVWPWVAQLGRGAGWYSVDRLDNGGTESAQHVVSWIPEPALGDASAIGYLRHLVPGRELVWWTPGVRFMGADARLTVDIGLRAEGAGSRLVIRMAADARGAMAWPALTVFQVIDSIMAIRQLRGIGQRVERFGARTSDPDRPETGARDQFQLYEVLYAAGERAGVAGKEHAERWRRAAAADGLIQLEA